MYILITNDIVQIGQLQYFFYKNNRPFKLYKAFEWHYAWFLLVRSALCAPKRYKFIKSQHMVIESFL